jgi:muramoyltetrapeptide carboxypeptidase
VQAGANYLREVWGNYGGTVAQSLADLHAMFRDPEIKMIWAIRGGSGCISLLKHLDFELIRANPKILLGYSDITACTWRSTNTPAGDLPRPGGLVDA